MSVEQRSFDGEHEESYYKLRPVGNGNSTYYVPVERAADRLRPLLTKEQIYEAVFGVDGTADDTAITQHIKNIRVKLRAAGAPETLLKTVWGVGYQWKSEN